MHSHVLLVSAQGSPADQAAVGRALSARQLSYSVHQSDLDNLPRAADMAVLVGNSMDLPLVDALRQLTSRHIPTLVLLRRLTDQHEASLLGLGAYDVVGLPSSTSRLGSRISALHRNGTPGPTDDPGPQEEVVDVARGVALWPERRQLFVHGRFVATTKSEFDLLLVLARNTGRVVSRGQLSTEMSDGVQGPRSLESHVSRLRRKVLDAGGPRLIDAVRGVGYCLPAGASSDAHLDVERALPG